MGLAPYLVRVGRFGQVGRFTAVDGTRYPRRSSVICRTARGLEVGEVLASLEASAGTASFLPSAESKPQNETWDGSLLRALTVEDHLLVARLERHRTAAFSECERLLRERKLPVALLDVEHLFDGRSLYFYFLGSPVPELDAITQELAATYDAEVGFQQFAATLAAGCGPGCGTAEATGGGCGSGGCQTCAVLAACSSPRHP